MASFRKFSPAVRYALDNTDAGSISSVEYLIEKACDYFGGEKLEKLHGRTFTIEWNSAYSIAVAERCKWRREHGIVEDARTHKSVPNRNMLNIKKISPKKLAKAGKLIKKMDTKSLAKLLDCFHSIQQAKLFATTLGKEYVELS